MDHHKYSNVLLKIENGLTVNVCRVCMCDDDTKLKCVFTSETSRTIEQFEFCTGILITQGDGLPTKLCESCSKTLTIAHKFKTACLQSNNILRSIIKKQNLAKTEVKFELEEATVAPTSGLEYQDLQDKQEFNNYEDNYDIMCNLVSAPTTINRHKVKSKKTIARSKKKISKSKIYDVKSKKISKEPRDNESKEEDARTLWCNLCNIEFNSCEEQIEHRKKQHAGCEWICEICGKMFKYRSSHYSHVRSHLPPKFQCQQCDYRAWQKADMNKHLKVHKGIKDFVCEYCTQSFCTTSNLRGHIRRHHLAPDRKHACPRCGRAFLAADKLRRHLDTHDNIKRFECEMCQDRFSRRCQWKMHLKKMHNISVPRLRPGRRKANVLVGNKDPTPGVEK